MLAQIARILVIIGGINWGLIGLQMLISPESNWNLVNLILGSVSWLEAVVYVLVGLSAVWMIMPRR